VIDHHPSGWLAREVLHPDWSKTEANAGEPAMAYELQEGILEPVITAMEAGTMPPGACTWPIPFLMS